MMNLFYSVVVYMAISGVFLSATVDNEFEKCGAVKVSSQLIYGSLLWPELLVAGILIDSDKFIKSTCDN